MERTGCKNEKRISTVIGTRVEVRTPFEVTVWVPGFEIADVLPRGFLLRRLSDGAVLPEIFPRTKVRLGSPMHVGGPFRNPRGPNPPHAAPATQDRPRVGSTR